MKKIIFSLWPPLVLVVIVAIFFYPVLLFGKVPLPADLLVGAYFPWLDYNWGYPAGVPVKNPIVSDAISFMFPMKTYAIDLLKNGTMPLWNDRILSGSPLLANFQSAPFSPTNFLYFFFDKFTAWSLQVMLQPFFAALFLFLLLKQFNYSSLVSLAGGVFYGLSGFMMVWLEWNGHSLVAAFFPLIFLLILKYLNTGSVMYGVFLSVGLALQVFSGYPQLMIYEFISIPVLVVIFGYLKKEYFWRIIFLVIFILLGLGLPSIQTIPGYEMIINSQRSLERVEDEWAYLPWQSLIMLVAPDFFGNHSTYNYWGPAHYTVSSIYTGIIPLLLAVIGLGVVLSHKRSFFANKVMMFGLSLIIISITLGFKNPVSSLIRESNLLGLSASSAQRATVLFNLGVTLMAAFSLEVPVKRLLTLRLIVKFALPVFIILILTTGATLFLYFFNGEPGKLSISLRNLVLPWLFLISAVVALVIMSKKLKYKKVFMIFLIILSTLELFRYGWKYTPFSDRSLVYPKTPVTSFLENQQKPFRLVANEVIPSNFLMAYGLETVEGYDAVYPMTTAQYLSYINHGSESHPLGRYGTITNIESPLLNIAGARYFLSFKKDALSNHFAFKKVFEDKSVVILENANAYRKAEMFYSWEVMQSKREILDSLNKELGKRLILQEEIKLETKPGEQEINILKSTSGSNLIKVINSRPGILFLSESYFPGWKVYVNGQEEKLLRANFNFMAVPINAAGESIVHFKYQPDSFEIGKKVSIASLIIVMVLFLITYAKKPI